MKKTFTSRCLWEKILILLYQSHYIRLNGSVYSLDHPVRPVDIWSSQRMLDTVKVVELLVCLNLLDEIFRKNLQSLCHFS
jgi:hypothetical protein